MTCPSSSSSTRVPLHANSYSHRSRQQKKRDEQAQATRHEEKHRAWHKSTEVYWTFLKALRSFLGSYSGGKMVSEARIGKGAQKPHPLGGLAESSKSYDHYAAAHGYEYSSDAIRRLQGGRRLRPQTGLMSSEAVSKLMSNNLTST